ncbi:MAG TPA: AGE family epimerase/isomerase [Bacillota bacterium]|nr:AGE family epimerase/isomerase [Bacillota bacterium]
MDRLGDIKQRVGQNLRDNILKFWMDHMVDDENGGFYGRISNDMKVDKKAPKGLVLNSRILWTFSAAYISLGDKEYLELADRAYDYLVEYFWDDDYKGGYWMLDYTGKPIDTKKQVYGESFMLYAFAEYYRASSNKESLDFAIDLYKTLESKTVDPAYKGYYEGYTVDWLYSQKLMISDAEHPDSVKTMNTHLHMLEAYTNLLRVWDDEGLRKKLSQLIDIMIGQVLNKKTWHFDLFFDDQWTSLIDLISYGHDIEGSWLMVEAAQVLGDEEYIKSVDHLAIRMAEVTLDEGVDGDGGLFNEGDSQSIFDKIKYWWPQAEALVGFFNAYQLTEDKKYLDATIKCWDFIENNLIDKKAGEWFEYLNDRGMQPGPDEAKADAWKCPYHNARACMELLARIDQFK